MNAILRPGTVRTEMAPFVEFLGTLGVAAEDVPDNPIDAAAMAADVVFARDDTMSFEDLVNKSGHRAEDIGDALRHLGLRVDDPRAVMFSDADLELCEYLMHALELLTREEGHEFLHVVGTALDSIAAAAVSGHVQGPEARVGNLLDGARLNVAMGELGLGLGVQLAAVFRHKLRQSSLRQRRTQSLDHREVVDQAIGFVDLVGFTSLSQTLDPNLIVALVTEFETRAHELAHEHDVRVVKLIGDEVMFVAEQPLEVARFALALVDSFASGDVVPRGGLAAGSLVTVHGDFFGPIVNLAARLVDTAIPGEVLVDDVVAGADGVLSEGAGRRMLKGFDQPVSVHSLMSAATG